MKNSIENEQKNILYIVHLESKDGGGHGYLIHHETSRGVYARQTLPIEEALKENPETLVFFNHPEDAIRAAAKHVEEYGKYLLNNITFKVIPVMKKRKTKKVTVTEYILV